MKYSIDRLEDSDLPGDKDIAQAADALLCLDSVSLPEGVIEIQFCGDDEMVALNREFRKESTITDVLSFEMLEEEATSGDLIIGCIAINCQLALRRAKEWQTSSASPVSVESIASTESILYILHGILHLAGYEDDLPEDRKEMFDIAASVLSSLHQTVIPYDSDRQED
ncbi:MAG: rRNA maturation RNase YbeY [Candidatus Brocadiia bacterium]